MSETENILSFNELAGKVFAHLYEKFPVPIGLHVGIFVETPYEHDFRLGERPTKEAIFFESTIKWLKQEGFLRYRDQTGLLFSETILTNQCLQVLNRIPDVLKEPESTGKKLVELSKETGSHALKELAAEVLKQGASFATGFFN